MTGIQKDGYIFYLYHFDFGLVIFIWMFPGEVFPHVRGTTIKHVNVLRAQHTTKT